MSDDLLRARVGLVRGARGTGLVLRILIVAGPLGAIVCTRLAAHSHLPPAETMLLGAPVVGLALMCVVYPDRSLGALVLALLTAEWLARVDDPATPWSLGMAAMFTIFHTSLAAASVAPPAARWTRAMCRRWLRRAVVLLIAGTATTLTVRGLHHLHMAGNGVVLAIALTVLALGGGWGAATRGSHEARP